MALFNFSFDAVPSVDCLSYSGLPHKIKNYVVVIVVLMTMAIMIIASDEITQYVLTTHAPNVNT